MIKGEYTDDLGLTLEETVKKYYDAVKANALYVTGEESAAEDVTQNVFTLLVERWDVLERSRVGAWIFKTLRNKLLEYFREKTRDGEIIPLENADNLNDEALLTDDAYFKLTDEQIDEIRERVLSVLNERERELYESYFISGHSYEEICGVYRIRYTAASSRINRIRRKLEKSIKDNKDVLPMLSAAAAAAIIKQIIFRGR